MWWISISVRNFIIQLLTFIAPGASIWLSLIRWISKRQMNCLIQLLVSNEHTAFSHFYRYEHRLTFRAEIRSKKSRLTSFIYIVSNELTQQRQQFYWNMCTLPFIDVIHWKTEQTIYNTRKNMSCTAIT